MKYRNLIRERAHLLSVCITQADQFRKDDDRKHLAKEYDDAAHHHMRQLKYLFRKSRSRNIKR